MSLFDGKPLTEAEVRARDVCKCEHVYGRHDETGACSECDCGHIAEQDVRTKGAEVNS